ncbi:MAG: autotransporter outer membrane beta-barrel domain-containing protein [Deltaproteobacteria bacterium]|nr:autotransporter outer membrane beta-barrel domain-containing protein [Deltaproteobacteria bacterium]
MENASRTVSSGPSPVRPRQISTTANLLRPAPSSFPRAGKLIFLPHLTRLTRLTRPQAFPSLPSPPLPPTGISLSPLPPPIHLSKLPQPSFFAAVHSYNSDNNYYGAHFGLGQKFNLTESITLEGYGKYFWTGTNKDEFTTRFGDDVVIDKADSSRGRLGARFSQSLADDKFKFYVGAAAEQEFDGRITGTMAGDPFSNAPTIKGTSGFGEIGISPSPTESRNITIDAEVFGWAGRQQGIGGSSTFSFSFNF